MATGSEQLFGLSSDLHMHESENIHKVDCESLNTLIHQYDQALEENFTKKNQFHKFRDDYKKLKNRLETLPNKLEYDAMVPISSKAICPGKIIHTNEIMCLLGENLFVECTAKKASEIVVHRLKNIDETLIRLDTERELYNSWKLEAERQMVETLGEGSVEIVESWDEDKLTDWRKAHRESVRRYHQNLAKERKNKSQERIVDNVGRTEDDKKLWTRLDALELEEEFMEAQALYEEKIGTTNPTTETKYTAKIREKSKEQSAGFAALDNKDMDNSSIASPGKKVTFNPENIIHNLENLNIKDSKKKSKDNDTSDIKEEVELYIPSEVCENGLYDPIFVRFRHEVPTQESPDEDELVNSDSDSDDDDEDYQIVTSPGDIYDQFGPPSFDAKSAPIPGADKTPLKSILKPKFRNPKEITITDKSGIKFNHTTEIKITGNIGKNAMISNDEVIASKVTEHVPKNDIETSSNKFMLPLVAETDKSSSETLSSSDKPISLFKKMKGSGKVSFEENNTNKD